MKLQNLIFTKEFNDILDKMLGENITKILISLKDRPFFMDFNEIDVVENSEFIRYTNDKGVKTRVRIGKGINKILSATNVSTSKFNTRDIERFVYLFKAFSNFEETTKNFELISGDDIKKWYLYENYVDCGSLGNSCMKNKDCQSYFDLYTKNVKQIGMLILKDPSGKKILGRAIIWKKIYFRLDGEDISKRERVYLMDRIYGSDDSVFDLFKIYATNKGWIFKTNQSLGSISYMISGKVVENAKFSFYLKQFSFEKFPYVDSIFYFHPLNGFISNKKFKDALSLNNTGGNTHVFRRVKEIEQSQIQTT